MKTYLESFLTEYEYPADPISVILGAYERVVSSHKGEFDSLIAEYEADRNVDHLAAIENMKQISEASGIHEYTGALLLFLCYTRGLRKHYTEEGIDLQIYRATVLDLRYKLDECICVHDVVGTFVANWFIGFFKLERFALGRLQFEIAELGCEYERNGLKLSPDTRVINVHIPRTGGRLDRESTLAAYKAAADFYRPLLADDIVFICSSWLLFPRHKEILKPGSNLLSFIDDFDIFASGEYPNYNEVWRLFDKNYDGDVTHLPSDSSLRRAYVELIKQGEKTGWGKGLFKYNS